ncbi:PAS domain S-box protein [Sphingomonas sp.]|uniref:PAS domain S-box protein n=1 Tax=Sphingomonas sp. TaxID=28214 RepID=UPI003B00D6B4
MSEAIYLICLSRFSNRSLAELACIFALDADSLLQSGLGSPAEDNVLTEDDIDISAQLETRPERGTDPRRHRAALAELARRMVEAPQSVLPRLVDLAQELTGAESAGISVEEEQDGEPGVFRWRDLTGRFAPFIGSTMPRASSPCGMALDFNKPILMSRPERAYLELEPGSPIGEVLMVPMYVDVGAPVGTLWVVHHEEGKQFDGSDARTLSELATFGGIAHRVAEDAAAKELVAAELDSREARYRSLFDTIEAGFCIIELKVDEAGQAEDYRFIEFNRAFEKQTGMTGTEGAWMRDLKPDHEQHWFDIYGRVALTGEPVRFENEAAELGRWYDVHAYRIDDPADHRVAILFNDITARRKAETQLKTLNERLEEEVEARTTELDRLWKLSRDPFLIADQQGRWIRISPAWTDILGWSEDELLGRTSKWMEHPDDRDRTRDEIANLVSGSTTLRFENRFRAKDDSYRWFSWTAVSAEGMLYCVARDVTDEKVQHDALLAAEERMRQSQKVEAVGQLTGGVAHDFNNLLTVIRGSVDLLRRPGLSDEKRARYINAIAETADRATKLTSQLLAFARRQALKPEVFDAGESVRAVTEMVATLAGPRIRIATLIAEYACFINADRSQFDTAIVNMAVNARDAMNGEGDLTIRVGYATGMPAMRAHPAVPGDFVTIGITDTGTGIAEDQIDRIFEPFFTTKGVGQGTGLGLSQVFGFAKQSGGDIVVESARGHGATFTLYLPRAVPADRAEADDDLGRSPSIGEGSCILVVEDNAEVGTFATQALSELGYDTVLAVDGPSALVELGGGGERFDVVFSDVVMPGMSGIELGREVKRKYPTLPVILTSGYSTVLAKDGTHGFELLQKPYSIEELSRVLRKVADGRR